MCQALCIINSFDSDDQPINKGAIYHCVHRGGNRGSSRWTGLVKAPRRGAGIRTLECPSASPLQGELQPQTTVHEGIPVSFCLLSPSLSHVMDTYFLQPNALSPRLAELWNKPQRKMDD